MCFRLWSFIWSEKSQENCCSSGSLDLTVNFCHEFRFTEWFGRGWKAALVLTCAPVVLQGAAAFAFPQRWVQELVEALVNEHQPLLQLALALLPVAGQENHRQMIRAAAAQNVWCGAPKWGTATVSEGNYRTLYILCVHTSIPFSSRNPLRGVNCHHRLSWLIKYSDYKTSFPSPILLSNWELVSLGWFLGIFLLLFKKFIFDSPLWGRFCQAFCFRGMLTSKTPTAYFFFSGSTWFLQ